MSPVDGRSSAVMMELHEMDCRTHGEGKLVIISEESDEHAFLETCLLSRSCYRTIVVPAHRLYREVKSRRPALVIMALNDDRVALGMMRILRGDAGCRGTSILVTAPRGISGRDEIVR